MADKGGGVVGTAPGESEESPSVVASATGSEEAVELEGETGAGVEPSTAGPGWSTSSDWPLPFFLLRTAMTENVVRGQWMRDGGFTTWRGPLNKEGIFLRREDGADCEKFVQGHDDRWGPEKLHIECSLRNDSQKAVASAHHPRSDFVDGASSADDKNCTCIVPRERNG